MPPVCPPLVMSSSSSNSSNSSSNSISNSNSNSNRKASSSPQSIMDTNNNSGFLVGPSPKLFVDHGDYRDHRQDPIHQPTAVFAGCKRRGPRGGVLVPFPEKLYQMLQGAAKEGLEDIVSWQPHGRCFAVHQPQRFVEEVMPRYFSQTKLTSFQRQVNLYGFRRLTTGADRTGYYHEYFLRGRPDLVRGKIVRIRVKGIGCKLAPSPETEPNFYQLYPTCRDGDADVIALASSSAVTTTTTTTRQDNNVADLAKGNVILKTLMHRPSANHTGTKTSQESDQALQLQFLQGRKAKLNNLLSSLSTCSADWTAAPQLQQAVTDHEAQQQRAAFNNLVSSVSADLSSDWTTPTTSAAATLQQQQTPSPFSSAFVDQMRESSTMAANVPSNALTTSLMMTSASSDPLLYHPLADVAISSSQEPTSTMSSDMFAPLPISPAGGGGYLMDCQDDIISLLGSRMPTSTSSFGSSGGMDNLNFSVAL